MFGFAKKKPKDIANPNSPNKYSTNRHLLTYLDTYQVDMLIMPKKYAHV